MSKTQYNESESESDELEHTGYEVKPVKNNKEDLYQPPCCKNEIVPPLPFGGLLVGKSGSGKTMACVNMMTNKHLLKDVFDYVYLFCCVKPDEELIEPLKLKKTHIFENFEEKDVKKICDKAEGYIKQNGLKKAPSILMIFDDILSNVDFMKSKTMIKLATANRHLNVSYFFLSQYYKRVSPVIRTNVKFIMFFPSSLQEIEKLADEQTPPNMSKKEFIKVVQYATNEKYNFLSINHMSKNKLRKNFENVLSLKT